MKAINEVFGQLVLEAREGGETLFKADIRFKLEVPVNITAEADSVDDIMARLLRGDTIGLNELAEPNVLTLTEKDGAFSR